MFDQIFFMQFIPFITVTICVYLCLRYLDIADMTCDGSFSLGAALMYSSVTKGFGIVESAFLVAILGAMAGFFTAFLIKRIKINPLLAGIITLTGLGSINTIIVGENVIDLTKSHFCFNNLNAILIATCVLIVFLMIFLKSPYGQMLKAYSQNQNIITNVGAKPSTVMTIGLMLSNSLIALSGAIFMQTESSFSAGIGNGTVIASIIALIIGENLIKCTNIIRLVSSCIIGTFIYKCIMLFVTHENFVGVSKVYNNLIIALLIVMVFVLNDFKKYLAKKYK